ncbi:MAG: VWA domain-containing protein [Prevotellaceae bacterium]|jgi:Ca-activated chloride channel family protein|nr:VWA domain-containing protein [Prevotellaceae bacterium]
MPEFEYPKILYLLFIILPLIAWYVFKVLRKKTSLQISTTVAFANVKKGLRYYLQHLPFAFTCIAIAAIIVASARPRSSTKQETIDTEGIDIVLALDISGSMLARDFKPDRIEAAKKIAIQFISERISDRIGLVVFAGESFTQCPLTTDKATLINLINEVHIGMITDNGTAIGNGLATAVARLKDSNAKSRVIILLTDGINNAGEISPAMAAEMAEQYKLRVYTIGVGTHGMAPYPVPTPFGTTQIQNVPVEIDEDLLKDISSKTDGKYFRATSNTKLQEIYNEINALEKTKTSIDSFNVYEEEYMPYALIGLGILLLVILLRLFILKMLP